MTKLALFVRLEAQTRLVRLRLPTSWPAHCRSPTPNPALLPGLH